LVAGRAAGPPWAAATGRLALAASCGAVLAVSLALSVGMVACFARSAGASFALRAWLFHQAHLVYSALAFVLAGWARRARAR
jgi:hypothetical protein